MLIRRRPLIGQALWTAADLGELPRKLLKIYPLRFRPESLLGRYSPVGNLGGVILRRGCVSYAMCAENRLSWVLSRAPVGFLKVGTPPAGSTCVSQWSQSSRDGLRD